MDIELPSFPPPKQRSSLEIFRNSLWSFILREINSRFGSTRLGYFWGLLDPAMTVAVFVVLHALLRGNHKSIYGESPIAFFTYGCVAFFAFMHTLTAQSGKLNSSKGLFNYRQIRPIDVLLANALIEFGLMAIVFGLFVMFSALLGVPLRIENVAGMLLTGVGVFLLGFALGLCFEVGATIVPDLRRVFAMTMRPLFFLSGTFYTIEMIPLKYRIYLLWNPVLHLVDLMRGAAMTGYDSPGSWSYAAACTAVLLFIGLATYRRHMHHMT